VTGSLKYYHIKLVLFFQVLSLTLQFQTQPSPPSEPHV
jgi:hypothetical protein